MRYVLLLLAIWVSCLQLAHAQRPLTDDTTIAFATVAEGKRILTTRDAYVRRMSPFDRAARVKSDQVVSEAEFLQHVGDSVLPWSEPEKQRIVSAIDSIPSLQTFPLPLPEKIFLIKTTGDEEGGAAYTRGNAVVLPVGQLERPLADVQKLIAHELFHVISRANPDLREKLYASIGFVKCDEIEFPAELAPRKITNPDAPRNDHCIQLNVNGRQQWAVPILFSSAETYDVARGAPFFQYLQFQFLLVKRQEDSPVAKPIYEDGMPKLIGVEQAGGFFEQVGNNTRYIIHPEEILADNFALLMLRERDLPSPGIVKEMEQILKAEAQQDEQRSSSK